MTVASNFSVCRVLQPEVSRNIAEMVDFLPKTLLIPNASGSFIYVVESNENDTIILFYNFDTMLVSQPLCVRGLDYLILQHFKYSLDFFKTFSLFG